METNLVFFNYRDELLIWLDRVAPQGEMFSPYNILYAWYYFGAKRPEAYVKSIETRHMNRIFAAMFEDEIREYEDIR